MAGPIDYAALAKKAGAVAPPTSAPPPSGIDYTALAHQAGAVQVEQNPDPLQRTIKRPEDLPSADEFNAANEAAANTMRSALTPKGPTITAAPEPTLWDRVKAFAFGSPQAGESAIGRAMQGTGLGDALGVPRTETFTNPEYAADLPLLKPTALAPSNPTSVAGGVAKGAATVAEGLTTAPNMLMMAGGPALGMLGKVSKLLPKAISTGFSIQMMGDLIEQAPELMDTIERGDPAEIAQAITEASATGAMAAAAGQHGLKSEPLTKPNWRKREAPKDWKLEPDREDYLKRLADEALKNRKSAKDSAATFEESGKTPTEKKLATETIKDQPVTMAPTFVEQFRQAEARIAAEKEQGKASRKNRAPKATVPEQGVPSNVEQVVEARDRLAQQFMGQSFRELKRNSDRLAIDDLVAQGHGFGITPEEGKIDFTALAKQAGAVEPGPASTDVPRGTVPAGVEPAPSIPATKAEVLPVTPAKEKVAPTAKETPKISIAPDAQQGPIERNPDGTVKGGKASQFLQGKRMESLAKLYPELSPEEAKEVDRRTTALKWDDKWNNDDLAVKSYGSRYEGEDGVETRVTKHAKGFGVSLWDTEANRAMDTVRVYPDRARAEAAAKRIAEGKAPQTRQEAAAASEAPTPIEKPVVSPAPAEAAAPAIPARAPKTEPAYGRERPLTIPGEPANKYRVKYSIRDMDDVHASHQGGNFEANPNYEHTNDRDYSRSGGSERVSRQSSAENFDPEQILTDAPTAEHGAPIWDTRGNVLGGNSRTMTLERVYGREGAEGYRQRLRDNAAQYGIDPKDVDRFKKPMLGREIVGEVDAQKAITDFNKGSAAQLTPEERAVSDGRRLSSKTVSEISARLGDLGEGGTMAEALRGDNGADVVNLLERDGLITPQEKVGLLDDRGHLTPEAKGRIGKALVGRFFDNPAEFRTTTPDMRNKLERIAPQALRVEGRPEWDMTQTLRDAIAYMEDLRVRGGKKITIAVTAGRKPLDELVSAGLLDESRISSLLKPGGKELTVEGKELAEKLWRKRQAQELMDAQGSIGEPRKYSAQARQLAEVLSENPRGAEYAFRRYANDAELSKEGAQTAFFEPPTPKQAFDDAFGEAEPEVHHASEQPMIDLERKIAGSAPKAKTGPAELVGKFMRNEEGGLRAITVDDVKELGKRLEESDLAVGVANLGKSARSLGARVKAEGGGEGRTLMALIEKADTEGNLHAGKLLARIAEAKPSRLSKAQRFEILDALEGRAPVPKDPATRRAYEAYKEADTELGLQATALGLEVSSRNGKRPFVAMANHFPHILRAARELKRGRIREDVIENLQRLKVKADKGEATAFLDDWISYLDSGKRKQSLLDYMVKSGQAVDEAEALAKLERYRSNIQKHGSLEYSRDVNLPFYDPDPVRVMPFSLHAGAKRLAQVATFGQDHRVINQEVLNIMRAGGDTDFVRKSVDRMIGKDIDQSADAVASRFLRSLSTLKMSTAAIPNSTQMFNTIVAGDLPSFVAGLRGAIDQSDVVNRVRERMGKPEKGSIAIKSGAAIDPVLEEARRAAGGSELMEKYLKATGFSATERFNRSVSANAGITWAKRNLEAAKGTGRKANSAKMFLAELGIDATAALRRGQLTEREQMLAAKKFSDLTQFRTRPQDLPSFATDSPWGKAWFQFKSFAYQQARFAADQTYGEIAKGRPERGLRNLAIMGAVFPMITGEAVNAIRAQITGRDEKKKRSILKRYFDDLAAASSAGILLDAVQSVSQGRTTEFVAGPAAGQAKDVMAMLAVVGDTDKTFEQKKRAVEKYALSRFGSSTRRVVDAIK